MKTPSDIKAALDCLAGQNDLLARQRADVRSMENCSAACEELLHTISGTIRNMYQTMEAVLAELDDVFDRPCVLSEKTGIFLGTLRDYCLDRELLWPQEANRIIVMTDAASKICPLFIADMERFFKETNVDAPPQTSSPEEDVAAMDEREDMMLNDQVGAVVDELDGLLGIIKRKLWSYRLAYEDGNYVECVSLLFHTLESVCRFALCAAKRFSTHSHLEVQELFARHLINTGEVSPAVYEHLKELYAKRSDADFRVADFTKEQVDEYAQWVVAAFDELADPYFSDADVKAIRALAGGLAMDQWKALSKKERKIFETPNWLRDYCKITAKSTASPGEIVKTFRNLTRQKLRAENRLLWLLPENRRR